MSTKKVLIIDDHPAIVIALQLLLNKEKYKIVGDAANGIDALDLVEELKPDLVILDIGLPDMNGLELIKQLRDLSPHSKILIFSAQNPEHFSFRCAQVGAIGFIAKDEGLEKVAVAIDTVMRGYTHFSHNTLNVSAMNAGLMSEAEMITHLNTRELVILQCLATGKTNIEIATLISASNKTVSSYKVNLMQKINVVSLSELMSFACRNGLV